MAEYTYVSTSGVVVPDTTSTLATVEQEFRDALGQNLNVKQGPQQVLIAAEVSARQAVARNNAAVANQINPNLAGGVFLDALWSLTGGQRIAATRSRAVGVVLTGQAGTLVPAGSVAATAAGDRFVSVADATLSAFGSAAVDFVSDAAGPIPAAPGGLTVIVSAVLGWETVTNPAGAVLGLAQESDAAARRRRRDTLALQGVALPEAIASGLYSVPGVQSLTQRENKSAAGATIDGVVMPAHGYYVCVNGGSDADVAAMLLAKASMGAPWVGGTTVNVTDPTTGQVYPVKFDRPTLVPVLARITVSAGNAQGDPVTLAQNAILDYVNGRIDGEAGFVVGGDVSPFELAAAVNAADVGLYVRKVEVTKVSVGAFDTTEIAIAVNELATLSAGGIVVIVV